MGLRMETKKLIQAGVDAQEEFERGNVKGIRVEDSFLPDLGRLPEPYRAQIKQQHWVSLVRYVIYSYGTPIAWVLNSGTWIIPDTTYSVTTTHHQNVVKLAVSKYDFWNLVR